MDAAISPNRERPAGQTGGHKPKAIAGVHRDWLIARCHMRDFILRGLVAELASAASRSTIGRYENSSTPRNSASRKPFTPASRIRPTLLGAVSNGATIGDG
jgi:putative transposase